jgi:putative ABC transport system permease protein
MEGERRMSGLHRIAARIREALRGVLFRQREDAAVEEELHFHLEMEARRLVQEEALSPAEARRRASLSFGGVEKWREEVRTARGLAWLSGLSLDFRLGARMLMRYWGLTLVAVFGMALGIALGAVLHAAGGVVDMPLPVPDGDRIVAIEQWDATSSNQERRVLHDYVQWRAALRSVEPLAAYRNTARNVITGDIVEPVPVAEMTASGFRAVRVAPLLGRTLVDDDERADAPAVVVIGYGAWQSRFGGAADIIGRDLRLGDAVHTIVGVMPDGFAFPLYHQFWTPLRIPSAAAAPRTGPPLFVFGRLADGASLKSARAELDAYGARTAAALPASHAQLRPRVMPYTKQLFDDMQGWELPFMYGVVVLLLLAICANIAILVYARTVSRTGEIAVRSALGASRARIVGQLFVEALALAAVAALIGIAAAHAVVAHVNDLIARWGNADAGGLPYWLELRVTPGTLLVVLGLAALAAAVVGAIPALRVAGGRVEQELRQLGGGSGLQLGRTWNVLVAAQVAIAVALLPAAASAAWKSLAHASAHPGFAAEEYLAAQLVAAPAPEAETAAPRRAPGEAQTELASRLAAEPGVLAVTFAVDLPGQEPTVRVELATPAGDASSSAVATSPSAGIPVRHAAVDAGFFDAFDVRVITGRLLTTDDAGDAGANVVVSRSFAEHAAGGGNVVGRRIRYVAGYRRGGTVRMPHGVDTTSWYEIVGVVPDFPARIDPDDVMARVYHALVPGSAPAVSVMVRSAGPATGDLTTLLRRTAAAIDASLQVRSVRTLDAVLRELQDGIRLAAIVLGIVMLSVLLLSVAGMYALMSFAVARRRREIGIRAALGAGPQHILAGVWSRALAQLGAGLLAGLLLATLIEIASGGAAMDGRGVVVLPLVALAMVVAGLVAAVVPARRALAIQPTEALRQE